MPWLAELPGGPPVSQVAQRPYTVVHLLSTAAEHGRAQVQIVSALHRTLDPDRYRLAAWFLDGDGPLRETLTQQGVAARSLPFRGGLDAAGAMRFGRAVRRERPALIHAHVGGRSRTALSRLAGAKLLAHFHGTHAEDGEPIPLARLARSADAVVATSRAVAKATGRDATVVYPGIDVPEDARPERPPGPPTIGTVARLEPIKQIDQLLNAAVALRERHPELRVEIAGDGASERGLKELARSLDAEEAVRFLGWRRDVGELHRRWHAFAIPSRYEGFGLAALEAMGSGLPVVGSDTGGIPELIEEGESGFLVPVGDPSNLADRLNRLLTDERLRQTMAKGAQRRARKFTTGEMSRRTEEVYDRLLSA
jgi:L-malate glycosyltransferase